MCLGFFPFILCGFGLKDVGSSWLLKVEENKCLIQCNLYTCAASYRAVSLAFACTGYLLYSKISNIVQKYMAVLYVSHRRTVSNQCKD